MPKVIKVKSEFEGHWYDEYIVAEGEGLSVWEAGRSLKFVGQGKARIDGHERVTGQARFTSDIQLPGMLYGKILRSPLPHGRIKASETEKAERVPGVRAVLTYQNIPPLPFFGGQTYLLDPTVRYVGDEVACVIGEEEEICADALERISVEYDPLPFVLNAEEAFRPDAPQLHPGGNLWKGSPDLYERGSLETGFMEAEVIVEEVFKTQTALHNCLETHGSVALWEGDRLTLWDSTQHIFGVRSQAAWMTDAYLKIGVPDYDPRVTFLWFTDPDHTAHEKGIGARETAEGIRIADEPLGRIFDFHRARGMKVNVFLVADHGFATYGGKFDVAATLKAKDGMERAKPVVIGGAIYVPKEQEEHLADMVRDLQAAPSIGPIFTVAKSKRSEKGKFPGTLSLDLIGGNHPRGAQIVAYPNWNSERNAAGYPGMVQAPGTAGHGATSPWEINGVFAAFGPDIKAGIRSDVPTSNADLAPTIAYLLDIPVPKEMDGRVLHEVLNSGPATQKVRVRRKQWTATLPDGKYSVIVKASLVAGHRYVDPVPKVGSTSTASATMGNSRCRMGCRTLRPTTPR